ncbi:sensor histidine kinase [Arenivirga flava]|uniref:histidine kinase n=1 Tax=Arenivirga flava TaxID=1930060 RepID=A0AA37XA34_9MICO|nr:histidine kinase [Arenivirga flava]GMA27045.1 hypothetical protein GCM10025874_02980 [Arenivirga flava]
MRALNELPDDPVVLGLAAASALLLLIAIALLALWRRSARTARRAAVREAEQLDAADELEYRLAEQSSRLRIIRELHEVAVRSVSDVIRQADGARFAAANDPQAAVRSLPAIAEASRGTLAELRRLAGIVREGELGAAPQPRMRSVRELVAAVRERGLVVRFEERGDRFAITQGAELAVVGILQEALENALGHGGAGTEARVVFAWSGGGLQVLVDDDGERAAAKRAGLDPDEIGIDKGYTAADDLAALTEEPAGRGIAEMRERARHFGGVFTSYRVPGVGFSVSVVFPRLRSQSGAGPRV